MCTALVSPNRLCRSPRISWYAPVRKMPRMYVLAVPEGRAARATGPVPAADEAVDLAVGVAGDVLQRAAARRLLVQPVDRHDREELVDRPRVGQRLEEREVAEVAVHSRILQLGMMSSYSSGSRAASAADAVHRRQASARPSRARAGEHAAVEVLTLRLLLGERGVVVHLAHLARVARSRRRPAPAPSRAASSSPAPRELGTLPICVSRSITLISSSAWCAVSARPDSEMTCGIGSSFSRHASASV
jgi:hypothetical protein